MYKKAAAAQRECYNYIAREGRENKTLYPLGHSSGSYCSNVVDIRLQTRFVISAAPKKKMNVSSLKSDFVFILFPATKQRKFDGIQESRRCFSFFYAFQAVIEPADVFFRNAADKLTKWKIKFIIGITCAKRSSFHALSKAGGAANTMC